MDQGGRPLNLPHGKAEAASLDVISKKVIQPLPGCLLVEG